jgi:hypothetical protein
MGAFAARCALLSPSFGLSEFRTFGSRPARPVSTRERCHFHLVQMVVEQVGVLSCAEPFFMN